MGQKRTELNETDREQKLEGNKHRNNNETEARGGRGTGKE